MESRDIRRNIIYNSDKDIKELTKICSIDKLSKEICSSLDFWEPIFEEHGFYLPKIIPTTYTAWISTFENERLLKLDIDNLLTLLKDNRGYLTIQKVGFRYLEILGHIEGIDKNKLLIMDNNKRILKNINPIDRYPSIFINDNGNNTYRIYISNKKLIDSIRMNITAETTRYIFHELLSDGIYIDYYEL